VKINSSSGSWHSK